MKLEYDCSRATVVSPRFGVRFIKIVAGFGMAWWLFALPSAQGSLVISNSDIVDGQYVYSLTYEDMTNTTKFSADVYSISNVVRASVGSTRYIRTFDSLHEGGTNKYAEILYRFDLTTTDFLPRSMTVRDNLVLFRNHDPNETTVATTGWSTNGVDYVLVNRLVSPVKPDMGKGVTANVGVDLPSQPSNVYYRVVFTNLESGFNEDQSQWNRVDSSVADTTSCFRVSFSTNSVAGAMTISKMQAKLNFAKPTNDTCSVTAQPDLDASFNPSNQTVVVDIGGAQQSFTLDSKGRAVAYIVDSKGRQVKAGTCQLKYTKPKPPHPGFWTMTIKLSKGAWSDPWDAYGLHNDDISPTLVTLPVAVFVGDETFVDDTKQLTYTAKRGKSGTAK